MSQPQPRVAIIGFGEAGSLFGDGLREAGLDHVAAIDPTLADPSRAWLVKKAQASGVVILSEPEQLRAYDVVLVLVPPAAAVSVAEEYGGHLSPEALYVDLTSCGPEQKQKIGAIIERHRGRFVEAAMLGSAPRSRHTIPTIAAGPWASSFAEIMTQYGMAIRVVPGAIGSAATIKVVRSILTKGIETLFAEAMLVAHRYQIEDEVLDTFANYMDKLPMREHVRENLCGHVVHAGRRAAEMRMSMDVVRAAGVEPLITTGIVAALDRTDKSGVAKRYAGVAPKEQAVALSDLDQALGRN